MARPGARELVRCDKCRRVTWPEDRVAGRLYGATYHGKALHVRHFSRAALLCLHCFLEERVSAYRPYYAKPRRAKQL